MAAMETLHPFSQDRHTRIAYALDGALEAMRLARRELEHVAEQPERWRWVALGLVSALQASLIAALSGYETAQVEDVANPSDPHRIAPVAVLLRRAASGEYLNRPERLELPGAEMRRIERLILLRNAAVHGLGFRPPQDGKDLVAAGEGVIRHLLIAAPAFLREDFAVFLALVEDELSALEAYAGSDQRS